MLTLSALYAALVYLFLAWCVKFVATPTWAGSPRGGHTALPDWLDVR